MGMAREETRYSEDHCWVRMEDEGLVTVGVTEYAPGLHRRVRMVELPAVGQELFRDEECGEIVSADGVFDIVAPVSGQVVEVNEEVSESPAVVREDPMDDGWLMCVQLADRDQWAELMTLEEYKEMCEEGLEEEESDDDDPEELFEEYE